ncbi:MAG: glycosyltransferase [Thomasclavelia sp.]
MKKKKAEFGITNEKIRVSVGELNANKNHEVVIKALARIKNNQKYKYILCGKGDKEEYLKSLVKQLNLEDKVIFAGYRNDVREILKISDIFCFPSYREGLSVALMEAMAVGLPVICSKIRGNVDLISENEGGYLCPTKKSNNLKNILNIYILTARLEIDLGYLIEKKLKNLAYLKSISI